MIKGFLSGLFVSFIGLIIYLIVHLGAFKSVEFGEETRQPFHILFQPHMGSYEQISEIIVEAEKVAAANHIDCAQTFGEFLDDPDATEHDRLRSRSGCVTKEKIANPPQGWQSDTIASQKYLVGKFSGSPAIGPWKVYSKAKKYIYEHQLTDAGPTIEIYTILGDSMTTDYLFPIR